MSWKIPPKIKEFIEKNATAAVLLSLLTFAGSFLIDWRGQNRIDYQDLIREYKEQAELFREGERRCNASLRMQDTEIARLRNRVLLIESGTMDLPFAMWLKSTGTYDSPGTMLALNPAYTSTFLVPFGKTAHDYVGKTDVEMWGEVIGNAYWDNDMEVIRTGQIVDTIEDTPLRDTNGNLVRFRVIKYPRWSSTGPNRVLIGIGGIAIPVN